MSDDSEKVMLVRELQRLYAGESHATKAAAIGTVKRSTVQRWESEVKAGAAVSMDDRHLPAVRRAVADAGRYRGEYVQGMQVALEAMEKTITELRASLAARLEATESPEGLAGPSIRGVGEALGGNPEPRGNAGNDDPGT